MALITLMSANGSPGVTTTALGLALSWPRPVILIDADPTGARAIPAGYFKGTLQPEHTIVDLAVAYRQGKLAESLSGMVTPIPDSQAQFLCGPLNHSQARALDTMWEPLAGALKGLSRTGQDVIVDAGRLGLEGFATKLVAQADVALLVTRSTLPALVAASSWAQTMRSTFEHAGGLDSLSSFVVGEGQPYNNAEVAKVLGLPVSASVAWDPKTAEVYSTGANPDSPFRRWPWRRRKFQDSALNKSLRAASGSMSTQLARAQMRLQPTGGAA